MDPLTRQLKSQKQTVAKSVLNNNKMINVELTTGNEMTGKSSGKLASTPVSPNVIL